MENISFKEIKQEHLIQAADKIIKEGIPNNFHSKTYDVFYKKQFLPPKLITSYAYDIVHNEKLDHNDFKGGKDTPCFKLLEENDFIIVSKKLQNLEKIKEHFKKIDNSGVHYSKGSLTDDSEFSRELARSLKKVVTSLLGNYNIRINNNSGRWLKGNNIELSAGIWLPAYGKTSKHYSLFSLIDKTGFSTGIGITESEIKDENQQEVEERLRDASFLLGLNTSKNGELIYDKLSVSSFIKKLEEVAQKFEIVVEYIEMKKAFENWLKESSSLSCKSILKYSGALKVLSKYEQNLSSENIFELNLDDIKKRIMKNSDFIEKNKKGNRMYSRALEYYIDFINASKGNTLKDEKMKSTDQPFSVNAFNSSLKDAHLYFNEQLTTRYVASLISKPFVLLSGLSGSGKTKIAQAFAEWICEDESQCCIVPVGADWTNREPLFGYVNALNHDEYILPENGALNLLIEANKTSNRDKPYFLILDEMNLSHVERYFADFLSVMESKEAFKLHRSEETLNGVPATLEWPKNLFVIGTVNIDETTYMFSHKVLDRANVIEFRMSFNELKSFLENKDIQNVNFESLRGAGSSMAISFLEAMEKSSASIMNDALKTALESLFKELEKVGAEFGYRTIKEIQQLYTQLEIIDSSMSEEDKIDIVMMQKVLPKLHGSRRRLSPVLEALERLCTEKKYVLSLNKIKRMQKAVQAHGFASYAEA